MKDDGLYLSHILEAIERSRRIVHDYLGVSLDIVWDVVENHLPSLGDRMRGLVPKA